MDSKKQNRRPGKVRDMTVGNPAKHIIAFALPLLLGNVFQQMYSMVDAAIVGKMVSVEALAAVGSAGWLDWLVLGFVIGLTQGFSIVISQRFGSGDLKSMRKAAAMSMLLSAAVVFVVATLSISLCGSALHWMQTPEESYTLAYKYVRIIFMGIPITTAYNLFAGMLRSLGNSRTPLIAMIISSVVNIALDLLFVAVFGWGVEGAAAATVIGQFCSSIVCLVAVLRMPQYHLCRDDWKFDIDTVKRLSCISFPIAGQNTIVSVGGVIMQSIINGFGVIIMAGITAASKISGLLEMAGLSIGSSMHTFAGQNLGAGKYARIREGVRKALLISNSIAVLAGITGILFGRSLLKLFIDLTSPNAPAVMDAAYSFLIVICCMLFFLYSLFIFRSTLQGMGDALFTILSSILQVLMRTVVAYLLTLWIAEKGVYLGDTFAWMSACLFLMFVYHRRISALLA